MHLDGEAQTRWRIWVVAGEPGHPMAQHAAFLNHEKLEAQWYCSKEFWMDMFASWPAVDSTTSH